MQEREPGRQWTDSLDALLARTDSAAHAWLAERLLAGDEVRPSDAPAADTAAEVAIVAAG